VALDEKPGVLSGFLVGSQPFRLRMIIREAFFVFRLGNRRSSGSGDE